VRGIGNSAFGWYCLFSDTTASYNTALALGILTLTTGAANTASGVAALILNTPGRGKPRMEQVRWCSTLPATIMPVSEYLTLYNNDTGKQQLRCR
jgi:hypothetical protein